MGIIPAGTVAPAATSSSEELGASAAVEEAQLQTDAAAAAREKLMEGRAKTAEFDAAYSQSQSQSSTATSSTSADLSGKGDMDSEIDLLNPSTMPSDQHQHKEPPAFEGLLKTYQLKGLNWLINLYDQGINGILADEMGLGKTVQTIAFLAHLASVQNMWGPFLIVAPSSTLHQWQQEVRQFCPKLKVLPYWGTQKERKVIRKYWNAKNLYAPESPMHVLITSYHQQ